MQANLMIATIAAHVLAAPWHQFIPRDRAISRMVRGFERRAAEPFLSPAYETWHAAKDAHDDGSRRSAPGQRTPGDRHDPGLRRAWLVQKLRQRRRDGACAARTRPRYHAGRVRSAAWPLGFRQVHAAEHPRRARCTDLWPRRLARPRADGGG
ncbi:hypothetical protein GXW75_15395 [Roseomonas oryzicola]|uniref:Uncharacterized protein n=1 Tax=Neoroseomonas oryzicola TaxID=535904 RepID=A0A9X9WJY1_9PROT|nr:hypothetical protein [Neoroseomonas oryzicola]